MDSKLLEILNKIGMDRLYLSSFDGGQIKIHYDSVKKKYTIQIILDHPISSDIYMMAYDKFTLYLSKFDPDTKVILQLKISDKSSITSRVVKDYITYYVESKYGENNNFDFLANQGMNITNNKVRVYYESALMEELLMQIKPGLERFLHRAGFEHLYVDFIYYEPEDNGIFNYEKDKEEIENLQRQFIELKEQEKKMAKQVANNENKKPFIRPSFKNKTFTKVELDNIPVDVSDIEVEVKVFDVKPEGKSEKRYRINCTNYKTSYTVHAVTNKTYSSKDYLDLVGKYVVLRGSVSYNQYDKEDAIDLFNFDILDKTDPVIEDTAETKRVELHAHTNMSAMDGISNVKDLVEQAAAWGHKAVAITDHVAVQSFPGAQLAQQALKKQGKDIKILYGIELNVAPRRLEIAANPAHISLKDSTYVFFDLETTGLSCIFDEIIEFGAIKVKDGIVIDRIDILIKPKNKISAFTTKLTNITNEMLEDKNSIEDELDNIKAFLGDNILVAHNASFDIGFLEMAFDNKIANPLIDTLPLSRFLFQGEKSYTLGSMCRLNGVDYDESSAHRGDYDAEVLKDLYINAILPKLEEDKVFEHASLANLQSPEVTRKMHPYHTNILVKNAIGMKNLFKILSIANTDYFTAQALVPPHIIDSYREGLIIGTSCARGEIFDIASTKSKEKLIEALKWYDYLEIQPLDQYQILVDTEKVESIDKVKMILNLMIECADIIGIPVCATGDVHYVKEEEHIAREVFISTPAIGGGYHPLYDYSHRIKQYPMQQFKTTDMMLEAFKWLGEDKAYEYVVTNPNKIADMIDYCYPLKNKLYPPSIEGSDQQLRDLCYVNAHKMYGEKLPEIVEKRLERELNCIISNGYSIMYVIASLCVANSNKQGFVVGSRGSVGSSLAATCAGITEVNPLKPHYRCPNCQYSDFSIDENEYRSGYDLPDKECPVCHHKLIGDGHNIPFETFLGFNGDKVPDIDLNFSALNQADSHLFIRDLFGKDKVYRAGTIASAASKTAFGYTKKYYESLGLNVRNAEAARIALMCEGVKRTTGQHPGGLIVIPKDMDVYDFTPVGHPADDVDSEWLTTHFDFHAIHDNVLKLDMLGHVDPTVVRMLQKLTGIAPKDVPLNDPKVIAMFNGNDVFDENSLCSVGLPEFGTSVARKMLVETKPTTFADLTKISGLSHGTNVYFGNIQNLILNGNTDIVHCIGCRDDIMLMLLNYGLAPLDSFNIMEFVRKGNSTKKPAEWAKYTAMMKEKNVPEWFIGACDKIQYLFPKAHAVAYCLMAVRIAWFKLYYPLEYYASYFTWRSDAYDIDSMIAGLPTIKRKFMEIIAKMDNNEKVTNKENDLYTFYEVAIEMYQRGISFSNIDLNRSMDLEFVVDKEARQIIPPFKVCDGIGDNAARSVIDAREYGKFYSIENLRSRTKLNDTNIKLLERLGVLKNLNETDQLTLF